MLQPAASRPVFIVFCARWRPIHYSWATNFVGGAQLHLTDANCPGPSKRRKAEMGLLIGPWALLMLVISPQRARVRELRPISTEPGICT
jgi:hypothetical protein